MGSNASLNDKFAQYLGMEIVSLGDGTAKVRLDLKPEFRNGLGMVHGAVIFALADYAFALAGNSLGRIGIGIGADIHYINPVEGDVLYATAEEIQSNRRIGSYRVIVGDGGERIFAIFNGLGYYKGNR